MSEHDEQVDNKVVELADAILDFAKSQKPDIGFSDEDLTYSICLVVAKLQKDEKFANDVLGECYAMVDELMAG